MTGVYILPGVVEEHEFIEHAIKRNKTIHYHKYGDKCNSRCYNPNIKKAENA